MRDAWLVIREKESNFAEKYKLFSSSELAYSFARHCGFDNTFGFGNSDEVGILNKYGCGDVDVAVIRLRIA